MYEGRRTQGAYLVAAMRPECRLTVAALSCVHRVGSMLTPPRSTPLIPFVVDAVATVTVAAYEPALAVDGTLMIIGWCVGVGEFGGRATGSFGSPLTGGWGGGSPAGDAGGNAVDAVGSGDIKVGWNKWVVWE